MEIKGGENLLWLVRWLISDRRVVIREAPQPHTVTSKSAPARRPKVRWPGSLSWWSVPLISAALVLWSSYAALTHRRYPSGNGVSGEIVRGQRVGQSFVARYPNLSGVELWIGTYALQADPSRAPLVLHLRSSQNPGPDLATAQLPREQVLGENPWYLFSFPPISDSQNKEFYVEVESPEGEAGKALTLFWWQQTTDVDPYQYGAAYRNGRPIGGDLAFGLHYSPSPFDAWAQLARAASSNLPAGLLLALILVGLFAGLWALLRLPRILRQPEERQRWLARWSLPVVLAIAIPNGLLYLFLVPLWQGPDEHSHFAYLALLDRHGLDAQAIEAPERDKERADLAATISSSMNRHNFTRLVSGHSSPGAPVVPNPAFFQQERQPSAYYRLCALALAGARAAGLPADPYTDPDTALRIARGVSLVLSLGVLVLAWLAGALLGCVKYIWLRLLLPLTISLFPMHAFIASTANNDILAELAVSALFVVMLALLRWPTGLRGIALLGLAVTLTVASFFTKATAPAAALPLLAFGLPVWIGIICTRTFERMARLRLPAQIRPLVPVVLALLLLISSAGLALTAVREEEKAAGWYARAYWPIEHPNRAFSATAHEGSYVLQLDPAAGRATALQTLVPGIFHPSMTLAFSGWVRHSSGANGPSKAQLTIEEGSRLAGIQQIVLEPESGWIPIAVDALISESSEPVVLKITADAIVEADDLTLTVADLARPWSDQAYSLALVNPSAEVPSREIIPGLARLLPIEARQMVDIMMNPQPFDKADLWKQYGEGQYRSFWGNFGWVSIPLPEGLYTLLGSLAVAAIAGLVWHGVRSVGSWDHIQWLALVSLLTLLATISIGFGKQMMYLATQYGAAYPQGRYLFVLAIPVTWLLLSGVWAIWSGIANQLSAIVNRFGKARMKAGLTAQGGAKATNTAAIKGTPHGLSWALWLWVNALFIFSGYCFLSLLAPYYYG